MIYFSQKKKKTHKAKLPTFFYKANIYGLKKQRERAIIK